MAAPGAEQVKTLIDGMVIPGVIVNVVEDVTFQVGYRARKKWLARGLGKFLHAVPRLSCLAPDWVLLNYVSTTNFFSPCTLGSKIMFTKCS